MKMIKELSEDQDTVTKNLRSDKIQLENTIEQLRKQLSTIEKDFFNTKEVY